MNPLILKKANDFNRKNSIISIRTTNYYNLNNSATYSWIKNQFNNAQQPDKFITKAKLVSIEILEVSCF
jgi:hypothetical protein